MGVFQTKSIDLDFELFVKYLFKSNNIKFEIESQGFKAKLKKYHRLTYLISLFEIKVRTSYIGTPHKYLFLSEILSDLLSNASIVIIGFQNSSNILTRRLIENFYNHCYYFDHYVEFELLNSGRNEYVPMKELKEYFSIHPNISTSIKNDSNIKIMNDSLFNSYHLLCRNVHTKGYEFMGLAKNLSEIKPDFDVNMHFDNVNRSLQEMVYLLYKFHPEIIFTLVERTAITTTFPAAIRKLLTS